MIINELYDVSIVLGNIELLDSGIASKLNCKIVESIDNSVPICKITFLSSEDFLDNFPIVDGVKLTINIKSEGLKINEKYNFRVSNVTTAPVNNNMMYSLDCIIDFYELFRAPIKYSMNNNSSEVFKFIAEQNNLSGSIYQSNDKQLWAPSETNLGQWLSYIAMHAWSSPQSGFYWFMNRTKNFFFIDIDRLIYEANKNIAKFYYGDLSGDDIDNRIIRYKNIAIKMNSGEENLFNSGYNGNCEHFDLSSYTTKITNANKVRAVSEIVNINKELSQGLGKNFLPFDIGNHHKNFFLAEAQNRRVLSTFSTYVALTCELFRPVKLSQVCTIRAMSPSQSNGDINTFNIKYIINKIIININSSTVNMGVELCSQGYNGKSTESY